MTYDNVLALDTTEEFQVPEDLYSALNEAADRAREQAIVELGTRVQLYLFEFSKITKMGGRGTTTPSSPWNGRGSRYPRP
jgi:uncharacterized protein YdeI (YjbR/CyaY-like superfamily)